jgi:hypothetical protein
MKRFALLITALLLCGIAAAHTINWHVDGNIYQTTTCDSGESITPPTPPYKYGYHFKEWAMYTPIEYLESTGTQYIDTNIRPTKNISIVIDFQLSQIPNNSYVFGNWDTGIQYYLYVEGGKWQWGWSSNYLNTTSYADTQRHTISISSNGTLSSITIDNAVIQTAPTRQQDPGRNLIIFGGQGSSNGVAVNPQKIYSCKLYDNNVLVRDFIPALDKDGTPCMYDRVEHKYYYNQGTGQFITGQAI